MKKINILILIILFASSETNAIDNKKKDNKSDIELTFSSEAFDVSIKKLPVKYIGHNFYKIHDAIKKIPSQSEFESTEAYQQRLLNIADNPLNGSLTLKSLFAFSITDIDNVRYDADSKILFVRYSGEKYYSEKKADLVDFKLIAHYKKTGTYIASNLFNRKVIVEKGIELAWYITFKNCKRQSYDKILGKIESRSPSYDLSAKIKMEADSAKQAKQAIAILIIGKIIPPVEESALMRKAAPTVDSSYEIFITDYKIPMDVLSMWIYNKTTGEIYQKIEKCSIPDFSSGDFWQHYLF